MVDVLDGLEAALCKYNEIGRPFPFLLTPNEPTMCCILYLTSAWEPVISDPPLSEEEPPDVSEADDQSPAQDEDGRSRSSWSDMSDRSGNYSSPEACDEEDDDQAVNTTSLGHNLYREQRVYIETNLEILIRIYTAIKRSGPKI